MNPKQFLAEYQKFRSDVLIEAMYTEDQVISLFGIYMATQPTNGVRKAAVSEPVRPMIQFTASHVPRGRPSIIDGAEL